MSPYGTVEVWSTSNSLGRARLRGRDAPQLFIVFGSGRWVLNHVSIVEDAATRDRPARGEHRDHATVETMCACVVVEGIGQHSEGKLCGCGVPFSPGKASGRMFAQAEAGIECSVSPHLKDELAAEMTRLADAMGLGGLR